MFSRTLSSFLLNKLVDHFSNLIEFQRLMGPVTAIAYGITIGDYKLVRMGFVTEIVSLALCIIIGVIVAGCFLPLKDATDDWPEEEMLGRGEMRNFYAGIPIAFFSGLGVAVGLLDSQTNSLVGVAISASLLPPAVNAGMLWVVHFAMDDQYLDEGMRSLFLTIMNIGAIIVASMLMFRLKEVRYALHYRILPLTKLCTYTFYPFCRAKLLRCRIPQSLLGIDTSNRKEYLLVRSWSGEENIQQCCNHSEIPRRTL